MAEADKAETVTLSKKELDTMLAKVAKDAAQQVTTELLANAARNEGATPPNIDAFGGLFERMAMAIAEISDQGTSRKRVAPEVLAERAKAQERAFKLLVQARENYDRADADGNEAEMARWLPEYRVVATTYLSERIVQPWTRGASREMIPTEVFWRGMPNNALRPINKVAKDIFEAFKDMVGSAELAKAGPSFMTPGGATIKGEPRAATRRQVPDHLLADDLMLTNQRNPNAPHVNVLGTIASPARQNVVRRADQVA